MSSILVTPILALSKWLKGQSASLGAFAWQRGYGCFSVGPSDLPALCEYIDQQEKHHRRRTFHEELRTFLEKYGVSYDEAYVWDLCVPAQSQYPFLSGTAQNRKA